MIDPLDLFFKKYSYKFPKEYPDMNNEQDINLLASLLEGLGIDLTESSLSQKELEKPYPSRNEFSSKYTDRTWIGKVEGKKYYLLNISEEQNCVESIARILSYGAKVVIDTPTETPVPETPAEEPSPETPVEETPPTA